MTVALDGLVYGRHAEPSAESALMKRDSRTTLLRGRVAEVAHCVGEMARESPPIRDRARALQGRWRTWRTTPWAGRLPRVGCLALVVLRQEASLEGGGCHHR